LVSFFLFRIIFRPMFLSSNVFKRTTAIGWFVLIILGSSIPGKKIPSIFQLTPDKLIHCVEYFVLGFLLSRWFATEMTLPWRKVLPLVLAVGALCGMTDELYQNLTPNRTPDFYDWCLDLTGVVLSMLVFSALRKRISWL
jgi:VanZ family protein